MNEQAGAQVKKQFGDESFVSVSVTTKTTMCCADTQLKQIRRLVDKPDTTHSFRSIGGTGDTHKFVMMIDQNQRSIRELDKSFGFS